MSVSQVVIDAMAERGMTLRDFANHLGTSHATVINWRDGFSEPTTDFLTSLMLRYRDWRYDFAMRCLEAKNPRVWGDQGLISFNR